MKHAWKENQLIGFSIKNIDELKRILWLDIVNMVELKPEGFARSGMHFYHFDGNNFIPNIDVLLDIARLTKDVSVQVHMPIEKNAHGKNEMGLNIGIKDHHEPFLKKFEMMETIFRKFKIGRILTIHPPLIFRKNKFRLDKKQALENARIFFERLDSIRIAQGHQTLIGLENHTDPKTFAISLGYKPGHFKTILKNTRTIGLTVDVGHQNLAKKFSMRDSFRLGRPVVNFHFHGNTGVFDPKSFNDDQHDLPTRDNVKDYNTFMRYYRRHRTPLVLEISHLERFTDEELINFTENLKEELK